MEIRVLACQGMGIKEIARELGVSRNTVRKYLRNGVSAAYGPRKPRPTKLDPFKGHPLNHKTVQRLMGHLGLACRLRPKALPLLSW